MHLSVAAAIAALLAAATACSHLAWEGDARAARLLEYHASFRRALDPRCSGSLDEDALLQLLRRSRVLFLGDHHRDVQLHHLQRRLLQRLHARGLDLALGLEAIGDADQPAVERFLQGRIDLTALRTAVRRRWPGSWLDAADVDADHHRRLLEFARSTGTPVFALEPTPRRPLAERDAHIAASIRAAAARHPTRLLVVCVGETHLLGQGDLIARTDLPAVALGARPLPAVARAAADLPPQHEWLRAGPLLYFRALAGEPPPR